MVLPAPDTRPSVISMQENSPAEVPMQAAQPETGNPAAVIMAALQPGADTTFRS